MGRRPIAIAAGALLASAGACLVDIPEVVTDGGVLDAGDAGASDAVFEQTQTTGCSGTSACIPAAPSGWSGPFFIAEAPPGTNPTSCPSPLTQVVAAHDDIDASAATCASCSCAVTFKSCQSSSCDLTQDMLCATPIQQSAVGTGCQQVAVTLQGAKISAPDGTGVCAADGGGVLSKPAPVWGSDVLGCSGTFAQSDCPSGDLCAPSAPAQFESRACVFQSGFTSCPAGSYSDRRIVHSSFDDTRGCSSCKCTVPTGSACTGSSSLLVYTDTACSNLSDSFPANGVCQSSLAPLTIGSMRLSGGTPPANITCTTSGGGPTGSVSQQGATTICCLP